MKDFDRKDIFGLLNAEDAKPYIGKFGYMADNVQTLRKNVEENKCFKLHDIEDDYILPFKVCIKNDEIFGFGLFLPADKVREEPKKWRPFKDFEEFSKTLNKKIGSEIIYRNTKDYPPLRRIHTTIMGYVEDVTGEDQIQIGVGTLKLSTYFEQIEIWNGNRWQPFGVEVEE